ncbi:NnrU protein [Shimia gijangensis]|uniref:NnrU protein n=1 Tax=Shimia gijangensis TaxID=1470563 RepID=A0A1M6FKD4_9RHOB|nr:NnrU family protein [Shimia gijangensis]SHI98180.1 NnrU protein [Shimia gijangensis]
MTLLVLGVVLWIAAHFYKRLMPTARASMGDKGKGLIALLILVSVVLMVIGYRGADYVDVYNPPAWGIHANNLLMLIAIILLGLGNSKSRFRGAMRHPMLAGVRAWAFGHLLVNGDLASVILFGGLFLWAFVQVPLINRAEPEWTKPEPGTLVGDIRLLVIAGVLLVVIAFVHNWLGYPVFPG